MWANHASTSGRRPAGGAGAWCHGEWTVPRTARRLGITRQSAQRTVEVLAADDLRATQATFDLLLDEARAGRATTD